MYVKKRRIYESVEIKSIDEEIKLLLKEINGSGNVALKGDYARAILANKIVQKQKRDNNDNMELELLLTFTGSRTKSISSISQKVSELERLSEIGIEIKTENIELVKGSLNKETINKVISTRDLTINEVILVLSKKPKLYWTEKCQRDIKNQVGILNPQQGTFRIDKGRLVASPYGITRLVQFLAEKKVRRIYLPQWWVDLEKKEAERLHREVLGNYGLVLAHRYINNPPLQRRMMKIINALKLTDIQNYQSYLREQELLFELRYGKKFEFEDRSFEEIQRGLLRRREETDKARRIRRQAREKCSHKKITTELCSYCRHNCMISSCTQCTMFGVFSKSKPVRWENLPCNKKIIKANIYDDQEGFFPRPQMYAMHAESVLKKIESKQRRRLKRLKP